MDSSPKNNQVVFRQYAVDQPSGLGGRLARLYCFVRFTLQGLMANRFQVFLTAVTMAIGSMGLALTLFLGKGAQEGIWKDLEELLGRWAVVYADPGVNNVVLKTQPFFDFTESDLASLRQALPDAKLVVPVHFRRGPVAYKNSSLVIRIDCIPPELEWEPLYEVVSGEGLSAHAHDGTRWECLLTQAVAKDLGVDIHAEAPLTVMVDGHPFRVKGLVRSPANITDRYQGGVILAYTSARLLWQRPGTVSHIAVAWHRTQEMERITSELRRNLDRIRGPNTYVLSSTQNQIKQGIKIANNFVLIGAAQSLFCVLIASIGVLNVMLANVARRAHEFALRVAVGASKTEILMGVLMESLGLGFLGALMGILAALVTGPEISRLFADQIREASNLRPIITLQGILVPFLVCGIGSILAGIIPALKIRQIDLLAILRHAG